MSKIIWLAFVIFLTIAIAILIDEERKSLSGGGPFMIFALIVLDLFIAISLIIEQG